MGRPLPLLVIAVAITIIAAVGLALRPGVTIVVALVTVGAAVVLGVVRLSGRAERRTPVLPGITPSGGAPDAAGSRAAPLFEALERIPVEELRLLAVRPLDRAAHLGARTEALDAMASLRRDPDLDASRARIGAFVDRTLATGSFDPTFIGLAWRHEPLTAGDRARLVETLTDAALALIVDHAIDEATYDELIGPLAPYLDAVADA